MRTQSIITLALASAQLVLAHGSHSQKPIVGDDADWMTKHMAEEHHIDNWDAESFFRLHDYNGDSIWQAEEMLRTYGLLDESNKDISQKRKEDILDTLLNLMDKNRDFAVSKAEWLDFIKEGKTLPDLGTGPGHHGDDEYEYEIHHWEKYHDENTKLEDLTHPEDIEHFKKHEQMEDDEERLAAMQKQGIVEDNIPSKFRRQ